MKPSDFYLSSRQIFGLLIPGILWLVTIFALVAQFWPSFSLSGLADAVYKKSPLHPTDNVIFSALLLATLAGGYVIGTLMHHPTFSFTEWLTKKIGFEPWLQTEKEEEFRTKVYEALKKHSPAEHTRLLAGDHGQVARHKNMRQFLACKRSIVCRSPELTRQLLEREDELNLLAMLPLPVSLLTAVSVIHNLLDGHWIQIIPVTFIALSIVGLAVSGFHRDRVGEEMTCYEIFLLLETDLATKPKGAEAKSLLEEPI